MAIVFSRSKIVSGLSRSKILLVGALATSFNEKIDAAGSFSGYIICSHSPVNDEMPKTHEITDLLQAWSKGDSEALGKLIPLVDQELKKIAHAYMRKERPGHILQTTDLVDEALLRLIRAEKIDWDNRKQFYALIAYRMRRILVDYARRQITAGGTHIAQVNVSEADRLTVKASEELLRLHQALTKLATRDARKEKVVELRYFGGYTFDEIAEMLEVSKPTVERDWHFARSWLRNEISGLENMKSTKSGG